MDRAIAYYRVSTRAQCRLGPGIEAQRAAVERFAESEGISILVEHVEAESGKGTDALLRRPQLRAALDAARHGDILHVAQSQHHDIGVARKLGYAVCWIERRHDQEGFGGTPVPVKVTEPDFHLPSLAALADAVEAELGRS